MFLPHAPYTYPNTQEWSSHDKQFLKAINCVTPSKV